MTTIREFEFETTKHHRDIHAKHSNYLSVVAAAAIAFSIQKTTGLGFNWSQFPLALAVVLWSVSFVSGCIFTRKYLDTHFKNVQFLSLFEEDQKHVYSDEERAKQDRVVIELDKLAKTAFQWGEVQCKRLTNHT